MGCGQRMRLGEPRALRPLAAATRGLRQPRRQQPPHGLLGLWHFVFATAPVAATLWAAATPDEPMGRSRRRNASAEPIMGSGDPIGPSDTMVVADCAWSRRTHVGCMWRGGGAVGEGSLRVDRGGGGQLRPTCLQNSVGLGLTRFTWSNIDVTGTTSHPKLAPRRQIVRCDSELWEAASTPHPDFVQVLASNTSRFHTAQRMCLHAFVCVCVCADA